MSDQSSDALVEKPYDDTSKSTETHKELSFVLTEVFDLIFPVAVIFGGIAMGASVYRSLQHGWYSTLILHAGMYLIVITILLIRRKLSPLFISSVMFSFILVEVVHSLLERGLASAGMMNLAIFCTFIGIFFGKRAGIFTVIAGTFIVSLIGAGFCTGVLAMHFDANTYFSMPVTWFVQTACFVMYLVPLIFTVNGLHERIIGSLRELKKTTARLEAEIANRKRVEQELRESEERYRNIFHNAPMGIFQLSPEGYYLNANRAHARMHGFDSPEELIRNVSDVPNQVCVNPDEFRRFTQLLDRHDVVERFEIQKYRKTGDKFWVMLNARNVRGEDGNPLYYEGIVEDITHRKRAEEALRESERKFRDLAEKSLAGIYLVQDDVFKYVNSKFAEIHESTPDEIIDKITVQDLIFPEDLPLVKESLEKRISGEIKSMHYEFRVVSKRGEVKNVEVYSSRTVYKGKPAVIGTLLDITERKRAEKALVESEAKYRSVVENSLIGFCIVEDDLFRFLNNRFTEITGYGRDELLDTGKLIMDLIHPDDRPKVTESMRDVLVSKRDDMEIETRALRKDGKEIVLKLFGRALTYEGKKGIAISFIDVSREKAMESELIQAQKMEAVGTLAGGIAHDFNNILTALIGYATMLRDKLENTSRLRSYVDGILTASEKGKNLIQSLLAFSPKQPISPRPVEINSVIMGTEKLLRRLITEDITLETEPAENAMIVLADVSQIDQILFNLAANARDAMPRGGTLRIKTKEVELERGLTSTCCPSKSNRYACISVEDTGFGMDRRTVERIFDPFFTTKEVGKGTGLGLSTVYRIVKEHNGCITVKSKPGQGTTFEIYLPIIEKMVEEEGSRLENIRGGQETVLIAEDDQEVRYFLKDLLSQYGYRVIEAIDGEDALAKYTQSSSIDLMILDSVMPGLNGREVFDKLRALHPDIKVLFISGYSRDVVLDKGIEREDVDFMTKPLLPQELLDKIREILDR